jgi:hypothetical protein
MQQTVFAMNKANEDDKQDADTRRTEVPNRNDGEATAKPRVSNEEQGRNDGSGVDSGSQGLRTGQGTSNATNSGGSASNGLSTDEPVGGYAADATSESAIEQSTGTDGLLSRTPVRNNYELVDKPNIALTPAKRRDAIGRV